MSHLNESPAKVTRAKLLVGLGLATMAAVVGCGTQGSHEVTAEVEQPMVGGTVSTGDPAVVVTRAQYSDGSTGSCTGTLIAPNVVLTASHCIEDSPKAVGVWFGTYATQAKEAEWKKAKAWHTHPNWPPKPYINQANDCAVIILEEAVSNVTPKPYMHESMMPAGGGKSPWIGRDVRLVGFGNTQGNPAAGWGTKRYLNTKIKDVREQTVTIGSPGKVSCQGDSGGPLFVDLNGVETVGGISSFGDQGCIQEADYARAAECAAWIDTFVPQNCVTDCSGKACGSDGCGGTCGSCDAGDVCKSGTCEPKPACVADCSNKQCGFDGCDGVCGTCENGQSCNASGQCVGGGGNNGAACAEVEPNGFGSPNPVCASGTNTGVLSTSNDSDVMTFDVKPNSTYDIWLKNTPPSANIGLYKDSGTGFTYIGLGEDKAGGRQILRTTATGGKYYLNVYRYQSGSAPGEAWTTTVSVTAN